MSAPPVEVAVIVAKLQAALLIARAEHLRAQVRRDEVIVAGGIRRSSTTSVPPGTP